MVIRLMGKYSIAGLLVLGMIILPVRSSAQTSRQGPSLGLSIGGEYIFPENQAHGRHPAGDGALCINFSRHLTLEIEGILSAIPTESQPQGLSQGRLFHIPVLLNLRFRLPLGTLPLALFLKAGGGYAFNSLKMDAEMVENYGALGFVVSETCQSSALFQAGGGLEFRLSPHLALEAFGLYRISEASGEWSIEDTVSGVQTSGTIEKVNLNAAVAGLGLRFIF